ncbi:MAG: redox-regulated ATPase YchF [Deltaproteobacteria bacterium]|nr:MAG: redox-regulated ATPase YchF [Deltaproteobacteria bacterium]
MKIGLVGYPGSGKTTVFNALTGLSAETGFGGKAGKANLGAVKVPDERVDALAALYSPKKITYAEVAFTDVPAAASGHGLDRATLNSMREVDALCQVVRAFASDALPEPPDPLAEISGLQTECILADLEIVERRIERLAKDRSSPRELDLMQRIRGWLEAETPLRACELSAEELKMISGYRFLTLKPVLVVVNLDEAAIAEPIPSDIARAATDRGLGTVALSARVEMDIAQMPEADQPEFYESLGLHESARNRFLSAAFALLDLISMLTAGEDECRAWPIRRGTPAPKAAGKIHSDIERGFIRAEVIHWKDLVELGSEARCREAGKLRVEGKDYIIQDGDVVHFRFNV